MDIKIEKSWGVILEKEFEKEYFKDLSQFVNHEYETQIIFPKRENIFRAFDKCPFDKVKIVIIGQDPYHGEGQANGLCFSVNDNVKHPPSLKNIFKEMCDDVWKDIPLSGNLDYLAQQGVLLLNATLTVRSKTPGSHQKKGWEQFTDTVIQSISDKKDNVVFMLWGNYAQKKGKIIDINKHYVLESAHPSPFSVYRGFSGNKHFSKSNSFLMSNNEIKIKW